LGLLCDTEDHGGGEAHYADRSSFDWAEIKNGKVIWACEHCRYELEVNEWEEA
jgi:hypothetical protein